MKMKSGNAVRRIGMVAAWTLAAVLAVGMFACSSGGESAPETNDATMITKTLVKTATNEMTLVEWDVSAKDSPLTISDTDAQYADYIASLEELTGFDIESITMQVKVTEVAGAEIAATHENITDNTYKIESLEAVVDGETITYSEGDFK